MCVLEWLRRQKVGNKFNVPFDCCGRMVLDTERAQ